MRPAACRLSATEARRAFGLVVSTLDVTTPELAGEAFASASSEQANFSTEVSIADTPMDQPKPKR